MSQPLHRYNPLGRFSNRAQNYSQYRPSYPAEAIAAVIDGLGTPQELTLADIGAGTGISSRLFAALGLTVMAIEPNAAMREAAAPHPRVTFQEGTAEQTGLPDASMDLVVCCQSFHWFRQAAALQEFHRILQRAGRLALIWNDRNLEDEFTRQYSQIISDVSDEIFSRSDRKSAEALVGSPLFNNFRHLTFIHRHPLTLESLLGLAQSASYTPADGPDHERMVHHLTALYRAWAAATSPEDGPDRGVALSFSTDVYLADPVA